ncbi:hypothetical protein K492DRAFT_216972 [Lichtheimia hyalospora FSU 10163]|nr:hypothetical protein K492DRAFT_216972 [Lichtheimia hyalospora FSU 10163]
MLRSIFTNKQHFSLHEAARSAHGSISSVNISPPFRVIFIEKDFMLPERVPVGPNLPPPHSNLSPLSTESPLHPDGCMTPLWVKKQLETPSVVVGFYDLWDWGNEHGGASRPKRETGPLASHILIDPTEREKDTALAQEINDRSISKIKGSDSLRPSFLNVNILVCIHMDGLDNTIDDPAVEERLSMIRKQSGLDNRQSFFTVAPGTQHDMQEFANGLYRSLYEPAIQYYNNRIKKVRKKRAKLPPPATSARQPLGDSNEPQPLSIQGWMLRYDYKAAFFQEMRQDVDGATKSYESAYTLVADMLAPKSSITPGQTGLPLRGKRWHEARTLIDCISFKICSFYLYMNEPVAALGQFNGHLHMMQTYCTTWGMGEQSFEYWTWLSKQYRIFADIVDAAVQHGFKIPIPTAYMMNQPTGNTADGCNPGAILQHPGFYYHLAAMCCAERRRRFLEVDKSEDAKDSNTAWGALVSAERQVDHSALTIDLLTKSYEQFKKYRNTRMTLYLAAEIAGTYYETGKYEMALKFFERIGKTYRKEQWHMVLASILRWSLRCAKEMGSWERAVECLVELLSSNLPMSDQKRQDIQKELWDIIHRESDQQEEPTQLDIQMDQINPLLTCQLQFKSRANFVNTPVPFQVTLHTGTNSPLQPLRFSAMRIMFNDPKYNCILKDIGNDGDLASLVYVDCTKDMTTIDQGEYAGWHTKQVDLRVIKNQTIVFEGLVIPKECEELKWHVSLNYDPSRVVINEHDIVRRKWLLPPPDTNATPKFKFLDGRGELSCVRISQRPPQVKLSADFESQALLNEHFELNITVENQEQDAIDASLSIEIKDATGHGQPTTDFVVLSRDASDTKESVQTTAIGRIENGKSVKKTVYLCAEDLPGTRLVTLTATYTSVNSHDPNATIEKREVLRIAFKSPFETNFKLSAQSDKPSLATPSPNLERSEKWQVATSVRCCAASALEIEKVVLEQTVTWAPGYVYNTSYTFRMATEDITEPQPTVLVGSIAIYWRRSGNDGVYSKTLLPMPTLEFRKPSLTVLADVPDEIYVGEQFTATYTVSNPTEHLAEYTASVELSDAFVFSGLKLLKGRVLPLSQVSYNYTCYPLLAGKVRLPRLKVVARQQGVEKEVPLEMLDERVKMGASTEQWPPSLIFVNARRYY